MFSYTSFLIEISYLVVSICINIVYRTNVLMRIKNKQAEFSAIILFVLSIVNEFKIKQKIE